MKILWENDDWPGAVVDPGITCLNWIPSANKPGSGLLAAGSESGAVGVTSTEIYAGRDDLKRYNFNLRGHHSAISIVAWNREQTKLASCDLSGIIYVWVPNEERWSVELVNDRGIKVRDVNWSPSGTSALICYEDNFVLIGSSTGQRIWSSSFAVTVTCGVWAPDSRELVLGFNTGTIQVLTEQGASVTERPLLPCGVHRLAASPLREDGKWTLAVCSASNSILFLNAYDEVEPLSWQSTETLLSVQWNSRGTLLAVVCTPNRLVLLDYRGTLVYCQQVPINSPKVLTAFTWAHDDQAVIAAAGGHLAIGRVLVGVPSLFNLVTYNLWLMMGASARRVDSLPLPLRERNSIRELDHHIIRCRIPSRDELSAQVCEPSDWRWYCTIRPVPRKAHSYVLCMEHMGGLVPILVGRQTNRIIPQFHISLLSAAVTPSSSPSPSPDNGSSAQVEDVGAFIRSSAQRNSVWRKSKRQLRALMNRHVACRQPLNRTNEKLLQVTSNVWCTRFKMTSLATNMLPPFLAQVVYKTSVLHLQPRQMTVQLVDLSRRSASPSLNSSRRSTALSARNANNADVASDHMYLGDENLRHVAVAPSDRELFVAGAVLRAGAVGEDGGDPAAPVDEDSDEPLSPEERFLYQNVFTEFNELRAAVERHIAKMKCFANDLERSSHKLEPLSGGGTVQTVAEINVPIGTTVTSGATAALGKVPKVSASLKEDWTANTAGSGRVQRAELTIGPSTSGSQWHHQYDDIEYIDEDDSIVMRNMSERIPLIDPSRLGDSSRKGLRQLNDISSVLDKLAKLASDLTTRCAVGQLSSEASPSSSRSPALGVRSDTTELNDSHATVSSLRSQLKDIAKKVTQIEKKINYGDELLDEVCGDLQQRVQHIKAVLGEQPTVSDEIPLLTMQNKAPFWNEASQVYQLDFGGRVTQESAKNFQIEFADKQVMQFGRIENGAYTLDFRAPFSAVQAFAVALASITQRLK
uniref:Tubby-related protein 4 n=1 Tax=Ascaris suum TaxID=6253 RepID=F1KQW7_ASCSU